MKLWGGGEEKGTIILVPTDPENGKLDIFFLGGGGVYGGLQ